MQRKAGCDVDKGIPVTGSRSPLLPHLSIGPSPKMIASFLAGDDGTPAAEEEHQQQRIRLLQQESRLLRSSLDLLERRLINVEAAVVSQGLQLQTLEDRVKTYLISLVYDFLWFLWKMFCVIFVLWVFLTLTWHWHIQSHKDHAIFPITPVWKAVIRGDGDHITQLCSSPAPPTPAELNQGAQISYTPSWLFMFPPLASIQATASFEVTSALLGCGADPNLRSRSGFYITRSSVYTHVEGANLLGLGDGSAATVDALLKAGADPDEGLRQIGSLQTISPLFLAVSHGNQNIVNALLRGGADPDVGHSEWYGLATKSPWAQAVDDGHYEIAGALFQAGANPDAARTILTYRVKSSARTTKYLQQMMNSRWENTDATTKMWRLISEGKFEEFSAWIGSDNILPFCRSEDGRGPMWWAHEFKNPKMVELLLKAGVSMSEKDRNGESPIEAFANREAVLEIAAGEL